MTMNAVVQREYGGPDVLRVEQVAKPTPNDDEVLIRIRATTVTAADCLVRTGGPLWGRVILGFRRPRRPIIGTELAGDVEAVGRNVRRFRAGDAVYGFTGFALGAYAEYTCLPERASLAARPTGTTWDEAAALVDGASTALFFLRDKAKLRSGQHVLINGASGSIGCYAVQLAKHLGAEVTGVCSSANVERVRALGADHVVDYTTEDFTSASTAYDVVFDAVARSSFPQCRRVLTPQGVYVTTMIAAPILLQSLWTSIRGGARAMWGMSVEKREHLLVLADLVERGILKPIIDRRYPMAQIADAHRYVDSGHKRGNVVITV